MKSARPRHSVVLSHLLPILFVVPWPSAEPADAIPVPEATVQNRAAPGANPPTGELAAPPKLLVITPGTIGIVEGEPESLRLSDDRGRPVRGAVWTVSDPTRAELRVDGNVTITGLAPGQVTVTATWSGLTAQARVTVLGAPIPAQGTAQMPVGPAGVEGAYFSDSDRLADRIIAAIDETRNSLDVAIFDLTHLALTAALEGAQRRGVRIRIVADQRQAKGTHSKIPDLNRSGVAVRLSGQYKGRRSLMHNKFAVFDGRRAVTGSFNWTTSADSLNRENVVFISDPATVARFAEDFERLWRDAL